MQFEKIRRINKRKIIVGGVITLGVIGAITILPSFAKYRLTESINIVNGTINYKVPDFKVMAMFTSEDGTDYSETTTMPESGYVINEEKTYCTTDNVNQVKGKIKTVNGIHGFTGLAKGEKCYLFFDKYTPITIPDIIAANNPKTETPDFSQASKTNDGVYVVADGMYSGTSYYWRGAVENNYVKFAGYCWRIVRINGDNSIRLIYDGESCHANGTSTAESIAVASQTYSKDAIYDRSEYVGYTYTTGKQRTLGGTASNLKTQTESWFNANITGTNVSKVATGKFCNDRNTASGYTWSSQPSSIFYYAAYDRLETAKAPTLSCSNSSDIYSLKVGAITADEVSFAGGVFGTANISYYLYNGPSYWTMSPYDWSYTSSTRRTANVFIVYSNGQLSNNFVHSTGTGVRPVINLRSDITFSSGDGTLNNPFIVAD